MKYIRMGLLLLPLAWLGAVDLTPGESSKEKSVPAEKFADILRQEKVKLQPIELKPDFDLMRAQRVTIVPARSSSRYNEKYQYIGVSLGNGIFIDADYNISLSLEKLYSWNLSGKSKFTFRLAREARGSKTDKIDYTRDGDRLMEMTNGVPTGEIKADGTTFHIIKKGIIQPDKDVIRFETVSRELEPITCEITRKENTVTYLLDRPESTMTLEGNRIDLSVPSDFYRSAVYESRTFRHLTLRHEGDMIVIETWSESRDDTVDKTVRIFQTKDSLYILSNKGRSYRVFQDDKKVIRVRELLTPKPVKGKRPETEREVLAAELEN